MTTAEVSTATAAESESVLGSTATVEVSAGLWDIVNHAARENSRYAINGVLVARESGRVVVVATDGKRLALIEDKGEQYGPDFQAIVPAHALKAAKPSATTQRATLHVELDGEGYATDVTIDVGGTKTETKPEDGRFPPYRDVVPDYSEPEDDTEEEPAAAPVIGLDARFVEEAGAFFKKVNKRDGNRAQPAMALRHRAANKAALRTGSMKPRR